MTTGGSISLRLGLSGGESVKRELQGIGTAGEKALQRVENATRPASKALLALDGAAGSLRERFEGAAGGLGPIGDAMSRLGGLGAAAAGGMAILATGFVALVQRAGEAARGLAEIASTADRIGISTGGLQELEFAARSSGVEVDQLRDGLKELALRAAEAVEGGGEGAEAFKRLGISTSDLKARLNDTDALFQLVVQRFGELRTSGERVLTTEQLFGGSGERLLTMLNLGADGLSAMRDRARELGVVLDDSVIRNSQQVTRDLDTMANVVQMNLNAAIVDLAPVLVSTAGLFADIARAVADVVDGFRELENRSTRGLQARLTELDREIPDLEGKVKSARNPIGRSSTEGQLRIARAERDRIAAELARREQATPLSRPAVAPSRLRVPQSDEEKQRAADAKKLWEETRTSAELYAAELERIDELYKKGNIDYETYTRGLFAAFDKELARTGEDKDDPARVRGYIAALQEQVQLQTLDADTRARVEAVMRAQNLAAQEGRTLRDDERMQIEAAVNALTEYENAAYEAARAQYEMQRVSDQITSSMAQGIRGAIQGTLSLSDAFGSVVNAIQDAIIEVLILRPLLQSIGGAFGAGGGGLMNILGQGMANMLGGRTWGGAVIHNTAAGTSTGMVAGGNHTGGIVGREATFLRTVDPSLFNNAKRYHTGGIAGLRPGEVPTILERGEGVFTREQMKALGAGMQGGNGRPAAPNVTVNVVNQSGQNVEAQQGQPRFDGEQMVLDVVLRAMNRPGNFRDGIKGAMR